MKQFHTCACWYILCCVLMLALATTCILYKTLANISCVSKHPFVCFGLFAHSYIAWLVRLLISHTDTHVHTHLPNVAAVVSVSCDLDYSDSPIKQMPA